MITCYKAVFVIKVAQYDERRPRTFGTNLRRFQWPKLSSEVDLFVIIDGLVRKNQNRILP